MVEDLLEYHRKIAECMLNRHFEVRELGRELKKIDLISYYRAKERYYDLKAETTEDVYDFERFSKKAKACEKVLKRLGLEFKIRNC